MEIEKTDGLLTDQVSDVIDSEEQLAEYLEQEIPEPAKPEAKETKETEKPEPPLEKKKEKAQASPFEMEEEEEEDPKKKDTKEKEKPEGDEEYDNIVDFLNKSYNLGLKTDNLPKEMTREQEAEVIGDLLNSVVNNANAMLKQYQDIDELLQSDEEIATLIAAKQQGKSFRDIAASYLQTPSGMDDESLVRKHIKDQYPDLTEEEVQETIASYKDKKLFDKIANSTRNKLVAEEAKQKDVLEQQRLQQEQQAELQRQQDAQTFAQFTGQVKAVYGVPMTDEMKQTIVQAVTVPDKDGLTWLDRNLQSEQGMFMAAAGLLFMEQFVKAKSSLESNRKARRLYSRLFEEPETQGAQQFDDDQGFNAAAANSW